MLRIYADFLREITTKSKSAQIRKISVYPRELLLLLCFCYLGRGLRTGLSSVAVGFCFTG